MTLKKHASSHGDDGCKAVAHDTRDVTFYLFGVNFAPLLFLDPTFQRCLPSTVGTASSTVILGVGVEWGRVMWLAVAS